MLQTSLHHHELVAELTLREVQRRFQKSLLNVVWSLLQPIAYVAVFFFVFSALLGERIGAVPYPLFLLVSLWPWMWGVNTLRAASAVLVQNASLIKKIYFPRELFVVSTILARMVEFGIMALLLVWAFWYYQYPVTWTIAWIPSLILIQFFFLYGLSLLVSGLNLLYKNLKSGLDVLLFLWLFVTPVLYPLEFFPAQAQGVLRLNPMAGIVMAYRNVLLEGRSPEVGSLGVAIFGALIAYGLGYVFFKRAEGKFADVA